ncbi:MAG: four helix bundle protein [Myxococcales bacterium]|nr:four helix bundle protein [Myxococcales bacterium]
MFEALTIAREFIVAVRPLVAEIEPRDNNLADQLRRAATSAALNTAEGGRRDGRDRAARYRIAAGECAEAATAVQVAVDWGYIPASAAALALALADRVGAMLWRLRHPRR